MRELPRGTVTFLFTDVEGSTGVLRRLGHAYGEVLVRHRELIRGLGHEIVRAEVGGGVWYRLRMLGFESQDEANLFCDTLKTQGQDCIVVAS